MSSTRLSKLLLTALTALLPGTLCAQTASHRHNDTDESPAWGLVRLSVAPMRAAPAHSSEQVSQALMGTPVKLLQADDAWTLVETPDGYQGYIINHSLVGLTAEEFDTWRSAPRMVVTAPYELHATDAAGSPVTDLVAGCILASGPDGTLLTPDSRPLRMLPAGTVTPIAQWASADFRPERLPAFAALYMGAPYLWGGLSSKGMDCSGLVRMAYLAQGRILQRDASQQALEGTEVATDADLQPGDLIFFGNGRRITHVAIYQGDGLYVHSSQLVRRNSLRPTSPLYLPLRVMARRRIAGTPLIHHPAYFKD